MENDKSYTYPDYPDCPPDPKEWDDVEIHHPIKVDYHFLKQRRNVVESNKIIEAYGFE